jgi:hypothetical protein
MARNLDRIKRVPTKVEAGLDNRGTILHKARFLPGATGLETEVWTDARNVEFDPLPETVVSVTKSIAETPDYWVFHQLDDTIVASPCDTNHTVQFMSTFNVVCNNL